MNRISQNLLDLMSHCPNPNSIIFNTFKFSGGEVHIKIIPPTAHNGSVRINCRINSSDDLMRLVLSVDALRGLGFDYIEAFIPYIPYARQDRRMVMGEPLSIKMFAGIINSLKMNKIICYDAHSDVLLALIDNIEHINNFEEVAKFVVRNIPNGFNDMLIVSPDAGAHKKVFKMCKHIGYNGNIVTASKIRNIATGEIISTEVADDVKGYNCLIVDDIIDGGRTFIELAQVLKNKGAKDLYLFASHGIFSKGYESLLSHFKIIGTTNSFKESHDYPEQISVIKISY